MAKSCIIVGVGFRIEVCPASNTSLNQPLSPQPRPPPDPLTMAARNSEGLEILGLYKVF